VTEIAFRGENFPTSAEYLIGHGFKRALTRSRMSLSKPMPGPVGVGPDNVDWVFSLFGDTFDRYTGCVPTMTELTRASDEGRIITVDGCGALFYEDAGAVSILRNIAVAKDTRGRGLGGTMLKTWISRCAVANKPVLRLWVADNNYQAINLYKKHGFKPDGLKSVVLSAI